MTMFNDYACYIPNDSSDMQDELHFFPSRHDINMSNVANRIYGHEPYNLIDSYDLSIQISLVKFLIYYDIRIHGIIQMIYETEAEHGGYKAARQADNILNAGESIVHVSINYGGRHKPIRITNREFLGMLINSINDICKDLIERYPLCDLQDKGGLRSSYFADFRDELRPLYLFLKELGYEDNLCYTKIYNLLRSNFFNITSWLDTEVKTGIYGPVAGGKIAFDNFFSPDKIKESIRKSNVNKLNIRM